MSDPRRHPVFAKLYVSFAERAERKGAAGHRRELLEGVHGTVVEVGCGHGANFARYPASVDRVIGIEPEEHLRVLAREAARSAPVPVSVVAGLDVPLPLRDASVDVAVASLVLCSVPDQQASLRELRRVIRPGGDLRFYEHVRSEREGFARVQRIVDVVWPHVAAGCHTHRDTVGAIRREGFVVEQVRAFAFRVSLTALPVTPHTIGRARRP